MSTRNFPLVMCFCLLATFAAYAQTASELNLTLGEQRVRFAPTRSFQEMRLEVVNSVGEIVFTHTTTEAEFDWNLRASSSDALAPGLYRYAVTLKFSEELSRQHRGNLIIERDQQQVWLTASDGTEVSGTALNAARSSGRSVAGFRTAEDKSVKRDVSERELVDEKGNKVTGSTKAAKQEKAALLGTVNKVAKFGAGGVADTDSAMTDIGHVIIDSSTNMQAAGLGSLIIEGQSNKERVELRSAGGTPGPALQGKGYGGTIAAPTATQVNTDLFIIAGSGHNSSQLVTFNAGTVKIKAEETWTPAANGSYINFETTPSGSTTAARTEKMRITGNGNLGLGTTVPGYKLDVHHGGSTGLRVKSTASFSVIDIDAFTGDASLRFANNGVNQWNVRNQPGTNNFQIFELGGGGERLRIDKGTGQVVIAQNLLTSALRQELIASAPPNVINGFMGTGSGGATPGNRVTAGVVGASIGGGGFNGALMFPTLGPPSGDNTNRVTDWFGTVGGGFKNRAGNDDVTLDDARFATVSGGFNNIATNRNATVGGGEQNIASGLTATVGGGFNNAASGTDSTIAGGASNLTQGSGATVGGGSLNNASGQNATASGGVNNVANAPFSVSPGGRDAVASHYGEMAFSSGSYSLNGDAQTSTYVLRNTSSGAATAELFLDGTIGTQRLTIAENRALTFDILVVGLGETSGLAGSYRIQGFAMNLAAGSLFLSTPVKTVLHEDAAAHDANVSADTTNNSLRITVQGFSGGGTYRWVATVRTVEVSVP